MHAHHSRKNRHQPRGLSIVYEDKDILVVDKSAGLLTMGTEREKEATAYYRLTDYVRKGNPKSRERVFIVHRLDRDASGLLVFTRTHEGKELLQKQWDQAAKLYLAIVHGHPREEAGSIVSYLFEGKSQVVHATLDPSRGKYSQTDYKTLKTTGDYALLEISLITGRKHQIRVQLAENGTPIVGDKKYGSTARGQKRLALHATALTIMHPFTREPLTFESTPPAYFNRLMGDDGTL
jgi:RluA family pseudouridine synthase